MDDKKNRRAAIAAYKEKAREEVGGLYRIVNTKNGWQSELIATPNLAGQRNRFQFGKDTNACFDRAAEAQWKEYGAEAFEFVEVEQLAKKPDMSVQEFREELEALLEIWKGK